MKQKINFNLFFVFGSLIVGLLLKPDSYGAFDDVNNFSLSLLALVNVFYFWKTSITITQSWVNYNTLFLLGFIIVHFQIPFLGSIGIEPERPYSIWINKNVVNFAVWLSFIALLMWILGSLLYYKRVNTTKTYNVSIYFVNTTKIDILLAILFSLFILLVGQDFLQGSYNGGKNWGAGANYAFLLLRIVLVLRIIYFFINTREGKFSSKNILSVVSTNKSFVVILSSYFLIFLFSGDRGPIIEILVLLAVMYSLYQHKISFSVFISAAFVGGLLLTIIGLGRSNDVTKRDNGIFTQGYENLIQNDNPFNPTNELATSNRILFRAIDVVPDQHPYLYGSTFLMDIIGVVPFAGGAFLTATQLPDMYRSSSYFFTILGQGQYYTYGEGSEILGDIYINFGLYGVFILLFIMGYFIAFIINNALFTYKHTFILIYVVLTMGALYINRSNYLDPLKMIFYAVLLDRLFAKKIYLDAN